VLQAWYIRNSDYCYAECPQLSIVILNVIMLSVIMPNAVIPNAIMPSVVALSFWRTQCSSDKALMALLLLHYHWIDTVLQPNVCRPSVF
jgi:hypothetical protein